MSFLLFLAKSSLNNVYSSVASIKKLIAKFVSFSHIKTLEAFGGKGILNIQ